MSDKILFTCRVCGIEVDSHPVDDGPDGEPVARQGVCQEHCPDHDYEYDDFARDHFCIHCGLLKEYEPCDDDVGFGSYGYTPDEPIGTPLSELAARPDGTIEGQKRYQRFVDIARSWGYD